MSDPVLAEKDPAVVLAEALEAYRVATGVTLQPADPRRLHLQAFLLFLAQQRTLIDYSGKQGLIRFVSDDWIDELGALWGDEGTRIAAAPSECTLRFSGVTTVAAGKRATDGTHSWAVIETTSALGSHVDALARCTVDGAATNGIAIGQIDELVDSVPGCTGVTNTTETISGREVEQLEAYRERLRSLPESDSTCGPRNAYERHALDASSNVADAVASGPEDGDDMAGVPPDPGEVHISLIEGERDAAGVLTSVIPEPTVGVQLAVDLALSDETVRPLTDHVIVKPAVFSDYDVIATYYIARSRQAFASEIQEAVDAALEAYVLWQGSKIGRDVNPSVLVALIVNAGAKRVAVTSPTFAALSRDECARLNYQFLAYGGIEND